jgi:hypothetical protein
MTSPANAKLSYDPSASSSGNPYDQCAIGVRKLLSWSTRHNNPVTTLMIQPLCMINPQTVPVAFRVILWLLGSRNPSVDLPATVFGVNCEFMLFSRCSIILFNLQFLCFNVLYFGCIHFLKFYFILFAFMLLLWCYTQINQGLNSNINAFFIFKDLHLFKVAWIPK